MESNNKIVVFENKNIRHTWHKGDWWFSVVDVIEVLTDSVNVKDYVRKMRIRNEELNEGWGQIVTPLSIKTKGGKQLINCATKQGLFRIIQSIPSKKAEPFKLWLAKVGSERIDEIENPELAQDRMKKLYEEKGYPKSWIEKRIRGIAIRQELTDEWQQRDVAIKDTKLRLKKCEEDIMLLMREKKVLQQQLDTLEIIDENKNNQYE